MIADQIQYIGKQFVMYLYLNYYNNLIIIYLNIILHRKYIYVFEKKIMRCTYIIERYKIKMEKKVSKFIVCILFVSHFQYFY